MSSALFEKISPAELKSLLKKVAEVEKALAALRSELNGLAGIKIPVAYPRPELHPQGVVLDTDDDG